MLKKLLIASSLIAALASQAHSEITGLFNEPGGYSTGSVQININGNFSYLPGFGVSTTTSRVTLPSGGLQFADNTIQTTAGGGGGDNLGSHISTKTITALFGLSTTWITATSATFTGTGGSLTEGDVRIQGPYSNSVSGSAIVIKNTSAYFSGNTAGINYVVPTSGGNPTERVTSRLEFDQNGISVYSFPSGFASAGTRAFNIKGDTIDTKFYFGAPSAGASNVSFLFDGSVPYIVGTTKGFEWAPGVGANGVLKFYTPIWAAWGTAQFDYGVKTSTLQLTGLPGPGTLYADSSGNISTTTASGSGGSIGSAVTNGTAGSILFVSTNGTLSQDNTHLFYGATYYQVGIGTGTPDGALSIYELLGRTIQTPTNMTTNSLPAPKVAAASTEVNASNQAWNAFDGDATSKWLANTNTGWISIDVGSGNAFVASNYRVTGLISGQETRSPKTWTLDGSNNNTTWVSIDTQTAVASWSASETRVYNISGSTTAYRYYRMNITLNQGDGLVGIVALRIYSSSNTRVATFDNGNMTLGPPASDLHSTITTFDGYLGLLPDGSGNSVFTSTGTALILEETGAALGTIRLKLLNTSGSNGAIFQNLGLDVVDFGFAPLSAAQANFRYEGRSGSIFGGNSLGEFEWIMNTLTTPVNAFAVGSNQVYSPLKFVTASTATFFNNNLKVEASSITANVGLVVAASTGIQTTQILAYGNLGTSLVFDGNGMLLSASGATNFWNFNKTTGASTTKPLTVSNILLVGSGNQLRMGDADDSNYNSFQATTTVTYNIKYTLPQSTGAVNDVLTMLSKTVVSGDTLVNLGWTTPSASSSGGGSSLAVTTGTSSGWTGLPSSSPTSVFNLDSSLFSAIKSGGTTAYVTLIDIPASIVTGPKLNLSASADTTAAEYMVAISTTDGRMRPFVPITTYYFEQSRETPRFVFNASTNAFVTDASTNPAYGLMTFSATVSSESNCGYFPMPSVRDYNTSIDFRLDEFRILVGTAADSGSQRYMISVASKTNTSWLNANYTNTVTVDMASSLGTTAYTERALATAPTLTSWNTIVASGVPWAVRVCRDGDDGTNDASTINSYFSMITIRAADTIP